MTARNLDHDRCYPEHDLAMGQTVPALRSQSGGNCHISGMQDKKHRSDTELLVAARTCPEPFAVFYERHFASVLAFFRRRVPGAEEAFDLAAETFAHRR